MSPSPYLSVVAASRNDDHGGDPLVRTQIFINNFARQCEKYRLPAELILVDWNPVPGRTGLAGVLQLPNEASYCQARIITVPAVLHDRFKYADRISFFQMIAKNAGIRRARGRFVLATNIDIIFSDELMRFLGRQQLDPRKMYRVDRYDIHGGLSTQLTVDETLDYAWTHPVRSNHRFGPKELVEPLYGKESFKRQCTPDPKICRKTKGVSVVEDNGVWSLRSKRDATIANLHTNACGDFTLLSREGWAAITGYPEFEAFSFHIDSFGLAAAQYAGLEEVALLPPCICFHIEHSLGSGWTPEGEKKLFDRLQEKEILILEWPVLNRQVEAMRSGKQSSALNGPAWGLAEFELPDEPLLPGRIVAGELHPRPFDVPVDRPVCALRLEFDLDRLTVWQERRAHADVMRQTLGFLSTVEKDAADRLQTIEHYQSKLKAAYADLETNIVYLAAVEKDSADRLATIHAYQEKLKSAYADHEHNVEYIGQIHAEIAAHVKISAEKDSLIANLSEQLRLAAARQSVNQ